MMHFRQVAVLALAVLAFAGCSRSQPEPQPAPVGPDTAAINARERARADSIAAAEAERRAAEARRAEQIARTQEALTQVIYFAYDSDEISTQSESRLQRKIAILRANPQLRVRIEGHADERGSTEYNLALGQRRAEAVRNYLNNYGIDSSRMTTLSYGKERPAVEGSNEAAWSQNRRAEFAIVGGEVTNVPPEIG